MEFLQELQLLKKNEGSSTGTVWQNSKGEIIVSSSPVDNKEIGIVISTDKEAYEKVIATNEDDFASLAEDVMGAFDEE